MSLYTTVELTIKRLAYHTNYNEDELFEAGNYLGVPVIDLLKNDWHLKHWREEWGAIELVEHEGEQAVVWHRPDGANSIANTDNDLIAIRILRYALLGSLIQLMNDTNRLSFIKVGFPEKWKHYKIFVGGTEIEGIVSADALLNVWEIMEKDNKEPNVDKMKKKLFGGKQVEIVYQSEPLTFF